MRAPPLTTDAPCTGVSPRSWATPKSVCATSPSARQAQTLPSPRRSKTPSPAPAARGAWETAGELLELAQTLTPGDERDAASRRAVSAAEHHVYAGDWRRARSILEDVLSAGSDGRTRCRALRLLGEIEYENERFTSARSIFEESLQLADDPESRAYAHLDLSVVCTRLEIELAAAHADAGLRAAEQSGDRGLIAGSACCSGHGAVQGRVRRRLGEAEAFLEARGHSPHGAFLAPSPSDRVQGGCPLLPARAGEIAFRDGARDGRRTR